MLDSNYIILTAINSLNDANDTLKLKREPDTIESLGRFRFEHLDAMRAASLREIERKAARLARRKKSGNLFARIASMFSSSRAPA